MPEMPREGTPEVGLKGAAEWAEKCCEERHSRPRSTYGSVPNLFCISCADAYARQQVEAFRERVLRIVEKLPLEYTTEPAVVMLPRVAAAIRALKEGRG